MYLNPALTGNTYQDRMRLNYCSSMAGHRAGLRDLRGGYDHNNAKAHSGYGWW
ncbi:MAG: hypothetical protein IPN38_17315 [Flavobacteriales bacterium]|nr:hypothetical protein [Flavobacteriales bacterium]